MILHGMLTLGMSRDLGNDEALVSLLAYNYNNFLRNNSKLVKEIVAVATSVLIVNMVLIFHCCLASMKGLLSEEI